MLCRHPSGCTEPALPDLLRCALHAKASGTFKLDLPDPEAGKRVSRLREEHADLVGRLLAVEAALDLESSASPCCKTTKNGGRCARSMNHVLGECR